MCFLPTESTEWNCRQGSYRDPAGWICPHDHDFMFILHFWINWIIMFWLYIAESKPLFIHTAFHVLWHQRLSPWISGSGIFTDRIWPLAPWPWIKKACFWACVPKQGPSPLLLSRPRIFYLCILWLSFRYLGSLFFPHLSSHMIINDIYKLSGIIHISFYALTVGFSKARVWRSEVDCPSYQY